MKGQEDTLLIIADELSRIDNTDMQLAADVLRGFLRLSKPRQIEIAMLGQGVSEKMASTIEQDLATDELFDTIIQRAQFSTN